MPVATPPADATAAHRGRLVYRFDIPLSEVASQAIRDFDAYWRGKMTDGRLPARADIDPAEIKPLLPGIVLPCPPTASGSTCWW